jgi:hypothetical protein
MVGNIAGNQIATGLFGKGFKGLAKTGAYGLVHGAPASAFLPALSKAAMAAILGPIGLANLIGGTAISANAAQSVQSALTGSGLSDDTAEQTTLGIMQGLPSTLIGHFLDLFGAKTSPSAFAEEAADLAIGNEGVGVSGSGGPAVDSSDLGSAQASMDASDAAALASANQGPGIGTEPLGGFDQVVATDDPYALHAQYTQAVEEGTAVGLGLQTGSHTAAGTSQSPVSSPTGRGDPGVSPDPDPAGLEGAQAAMDAADADADGSPTVLCTVLHDKGIMSDEIYEKDSQYGKNLPQDTIDGYHIWAIPVAGWMTKSDLLLKVVTLPVMAWARHMAGQRNLFGYICEKAGVPVCKIIGRLKNLPIVNNNWRSI